MYHVKGSFHLVLPFTYNLTIYCIYNPTAVQFVCFFFFFFCVTILAVSRVVNFLLSNKKPWMYLHLHMHKDARKSINLLSFIRFTTRSFLKMENLEGCLVNWFHINWSMVVFFSFFLFVFFILYQILNIQILLLWVRFCHYFRYHLVVYFSRPPFSFIPVLEKNCNPWTVIKLVKREFLLIFFEGAVSRRRTQSIIYVWVTCARLNWMYDHCSRNNET